MSDFKGDGCQQRFYKGAYLLSVYFLSSLLSLLLIIIIYVSAEEKTIRDVKSARLKNLKTINLEDLEMILQE